MSATRIGNLWYVTHRAFGLVATLRHKPTTAELCKIAKGLS